MRLLPFVGSDPEKPSSLAIKERAIGLPIQRSRITASVKAWPGIALRFAEKRNPNKSPLPTPLYCPPSKPRLTFGVAGL